MEGVPNLSTVVFGQLWYAGNTFTASRIPFLDKAADENVARSYALLAMRSYCNLLVLTSKSTPAV